MNIMELLAPAGNFEKLKSAINFGADAVYFSGKQFGLRAFAGNFENDEILQAVEYVHNAGKKAYITINILAHEQDFAGLKEYVQFLQNAKVDAVIVSDVGIIQFIKENAPDLNIHVSTQANVLNSYAIKFYAQMGVKRIILAREVSIEEIKLIRKNIPESIELEAFVHGAMCISYSGRCLLSNYLVGRDSNRGACVQACRWKYYISEENRKTEKYEIEEDEKGTYILNSKDLNMLKHLPELIEAGVSSFKIEGRMKSEYYVANVVNAYRRAIDYFEKVGDKIDEKIICELDKELEKSSHRHYTTGFFLGEKNKEYLQTSLPIQTHEFVAIVLEDTHNGYTLIEQRNRLCKDDVLEVLSRDGSFNQQLVIDEIIDENNEKILDVKRVQEKLKIATNLNLKKGDFLRKKIEN